MSPTTPTETSSHGAPSSQAAPGAPTDEGWTQQRVDLTINGQRHTLELATWTTLLDLLRLDLGLTGTKKGCDHGQCGACTVLIDGQRKNSCLQLAVLQDGREITTIEGLADGDRLHPLQEAFIEHDAFQCGYCTPGQICSAAGLLAEGRAHTRDEVREWMSGNLCRCGAYSNIADAVEEVLNRERGQGSDQGSGKAAGQAGRGARA